MLDLATSRKSLASANDASLIERVFPVTRLSAESFKEQDAKQSKTLTVTGSYWKGRKPLILVRACVLGCLLPSSGDDAESRRQDLRMFLKLLRMDDDGLRSRWSGAMDAATIHQYLDTDERERFFQPGAVKATWRAGDTSRKRLAASLAFERMPYATRIKHCIRPEEMKTDGDFAEINEYFGTTATDIQDFVLQLGERRFGHRPRLSDRFAGGGSIPFEAARIGCDVEASDLNPVAGMLTWGALNVVGGSPEFLAGLAAAQSRVARRLKGKLDELGVERDASGKQAKAYLYCLETKCPTTGWMIPITPTFVINKLKRVIVEIEADPANKRFLFRCVRDASEEQMRVADIGTIPPQMRNGKLKGGNDLVYEVEGISFRRSLKAIRGEGLGADDGNMLRSWTLEDFQPSPVDILQERLMCIRWIGEDDADVYDVPNADDDIRERKVVELVSASLSRWQSEGLVPDMEIKPGAKTSELIRTRGWTHWHHLFHPRQLLTLAILRESISQEPEPRIQAALVLNFNKVLDYSTKLSHWHPGWAKPENLFYNQAFNTFLNYGVRAYPLLEGILEEASRRTSKMPGRASIAVEPATAVSRQSDLFITDPPYADAIYYHEITEFFIAWDRKNPPQPFAGWTWDSRRRLAIQGKDVGFRQQMIAAYKAMAAFMPDGGMQVVMFTHQDPGVWADLGMILWASGLRVTGAWCITTEVPKIVTVGNNVKGTVLLVLRKRLTTSNGWSDEVLMEVEDEVKAQLQSMLDLEGESETDGVRNFSDADYQLAAYAAALRVVTGYATIDKRDVGAEALRERTKGEKTEIQKLIEKAVEVANNYLVPSGVSDGLWAELDRESRFYLKMVEVEAKGDRQLSSYAEFARGFGLTDHKRLMGNDKANEARLRWAVDWKGRDLGESEFGRGLVRHVLFGIWTVMKTEHTKEAVAYLHQEVPEYWRKRQALVEVARYLADRQTVGKEAECDAAALLAGAVSTDRM